MFVANIDAEMCPRKLQNPFQSFVQSMLLQRGSCQLCAPLFQKHMEPLKKTVAKQVALPMIRPFKIPAHIQVHQ